MNIGKNYYKAVSYNINHDKIGKSGNLKNHATLKNLVEVSDSDYAVNFSPLS